MKLWSWILSIMGLTGTYLTGKRYWWAWVVMSFYNVTWIVYSVISKQYGFLLASCVYQVIYFRNAVEWRKDGRGQKIK